MVLQFVGARRFKNIVYFYLIALLCLYPFIMIRRYRIISILGDVSEKLRVRF